MDKYESLLRDLKEILETIDEVNLVSFGKTAPLDSEDRFTAVYIVPEMDTFTQHKLGKQFDSYTNTFFVRLNVNMNCQEDDLLWVKTRHKITNTLLNDVAIWNNIIDRDIVSVAHDDYKNYPRKSMAMLFEFKVRSDCVI
jgi:hypothetical protein